MNSKIIVSFLIAILLSLSSIGQTDTLSQKLDYSAPKVYEIGGITVTGTEFLDENILVQLSGLVVGDPINIPGEEIPNAIRSLWKQNLFSDVQIYASNIINEIIFLEIRLVERPRLSKFSLKGVKKIDADDIREKVQLFSGRILDENTLNNTKQIILNYYKDKGYYLADVSFSTEPDPKLPNYVVLDIDVRRGSRIRINDIIVYDNDNVYSRNIKKSMKDTKEKFKINTKTPKMVWKDLKKAKLGQSLGNVSWATAMNYIDDKVRLRLFSNSKYLEDSYETDKKTVIQLYNSKGYRDARIIQDTVYFVDSKNVNIEMVMDEGKKYYFRDIEWKGNSKYTNEQLAKVLNIKKGDVYDQALLQTRLFMDPAQNDISSLYMDDGYLFFQVNPIESKIEEDSIDLQMRIYEGPQATINNIIIKGNDRTKEHVIRRELFSMPGSKFRRSDIMRSQQQIAGLGYFDPEGIGILPIPNQADGTVDIEYTVAERPSDQLELSAGWSGQNVIGSVGISFNNFSLRELFNKGGWDPLPQGDGQRLSVRFQTYGPGYLSLNTSFTEPWLGGKKPNSLTVSVSRTRFSNDNGFFNSTVDEEDKQILNVQSYSVGLGRRLNFPDDRFTLTNTLSYQRYSMQNYNNFIYSDGFSNVISLTTILGRYSLDSPIYPRSGSNFSLSLQLTPPYSRFSDKDYASLEDNEKYKFAEFHKWKFKAEWYTPIDRQNKLVLMTSVKLGLMGFYDAGIGHSPFERFRLGGDGFASQGSFFLLGEEIISTRGYEEFGTSHPFFNKFTMELRYPLSLAPTSTIYVLGFLQGSNSYPDFKSYNPFKLRRSAGLGLRIFLPMFGTLGFDYGVGFDNTGDQNVPFWDYLNNFGRFNIVLGVEPE